MDTEYTTNHKKKASSARQGRRQFHWNQANRPKFGPQNEWETDEEFGVKTRTAEQRRRYLWTGTF